MRRIDESAGLGTPEETNARFKYLLAAEETGLSLPLDLPTQLGLDPDDPEAEGEVGKTGVSIASLADMERLFDGIPLDRVSTSLMSDGTASILAAMYEEVATRQGVPPERITGMVRNDPLKEFGARGAWIFPVEPSMRLATDLIESCIERLPRFSPISISCPVRNAGTSPSAEAAYALSAGRAYVEACLARGLGIDRFARRFSFTWQTHAHLFEEVATYRATRRIWARMLQEEFGAVENGAEGRATADPLGSSFVEALTDTMEAKIRRKMDELQARGGLFEALQQGEVGGDPLESETSSEPAPLPSASPPALEERRAQLARVRASRSAVAVAMALEQLEMTARSHQNLMPSIRAAVAAYATVGEVTQSLRRVFGRYLPPPRPPTLFSTQGASPTP